MQKEQMKSKLLSKKIQAFIDQTNILICPGCLQQYDQKLAPPIIICQNQHTLCFVCVQNKVFCKNALTGQYQCILCRQNILGPPLKKAQKQIQYINLTQKLKKMFAPYIDQFSQKHSQFQKQFTKAQNKLKKINQKHKQYDQQMVKLTQIQNNFDMFNKKQKKNKQQLQKRLTKMEKSFRDTHDYEFSKVKQQNKETEQILKRLKNNQMKMAEDFQKLTLRTKSLETWKMVLAIFVATILAFCIALKKQFSVVGTQAEFLQKSTVQINRMLLKFHKQYNSQFQQINDKVFGLQNKILDFERHFNTTQQTFNKIENSLTARMQKMQKIERYANHPQNINNPNNPNKNHRNIEQRVTNIYNSIKAQERQRKLLTSSLNLVKEDFKKEIQVVRVKIQEVHSKVINVVMTHPKNLQVAKQELKAQIQKVGELVELNSQSSITTRLSLIQTRIKQIQQQAKNILIQLNKNYIIKNQKDIITKINSANFISQMAFQSIKLLKHDVDIIEYQFQDFILQPTIQEQGFCEKDQYNTIPYRPNLIKFIPDLNFNETIHFAFYKKLQFAQLNKYENKNYTYGEENAYQGIVSIDQIGTYGVFQFNVVLEFTEQMDIFIGVVTQKGRNISQAMFTNQFIGFYYKYRMFMQDGQLQVDKNLDQDPYQRQIQTLVRINRFNHTLSVLLTYDYTDFYYQTILPQKFRQINLFPAIYMKTDRDIIQFNFKRNEYFNMFYKYVLSNRMEIERDTLMRTKFYRNQLTCNSARAFSRLTNLRFYDIVPSVEELIKNKELMNEKNGQLKIANTLSGRKIIFKQNQRLPQRHRPQNSHNNQKVQQNGLRKL